MTTVRVTVGGERPYQVLAGAGVLRELPALTGDGAVALLHSAAVARAAAAATGHLAAAGRQVHTREIPDGEAAKDITVAADLWSWLAARRIGRADCLVGVGGGAACDLAGFVAATWLRGVRVVLVPTTLLAMVDAAVGGKAAVNIAAGKNLVGAFHQPAGVLADLSALGTLPAREYVSGLAEVIKAGFIADPVILDLVEADPEQAATPGGKAELELVERAIRVKAAVVTGDPREAGQREFLNYGHTLGHAIEQAEGFRFRHGEAVSIGMTYAAELGRLAGRLDPGTARRHRDLLAAVGLPTRYPRAAWPALRTAMAVDKKSRAARLRFVVLDGPARPGILADPDEDLLRQAYEGICAP